MQALTDNMGLHAYVDLDRLNKNQVLQTMQQIVDGVNIQDLEVLRASLALEMINEREESPEAQPHPPTADPDKKQWGFVCDHCNANIRQKNDFHKHQQYGTQRSGFKVYKQSCHCRMIQCLKRRQDGTAVLEQKLVASHAWPARML